MKELGLQEAVDEIVDTRRRAEGKGKPSPFFFIVGAGVSAPAVPLASEIERLCRAELERRGKKALAPAADPMARYEEAFKAAYPHPAERQEFLHDLIHSKPITWANLRLAHLLGERQLSTLLFTPNFDEMLSRGLRFLGYDAVICDHPKTTRRIQLQQTDRVQLVHVHGTHWFYDCCNLRDEIVERAENDPLGNQSMPALLEGALSQGSPLVVGYSGWEKDVIMKALWRRLNKEQLGYHLYWFCYRREEAARLPEWLKSHEHVRLVLPPSVPDAEDKLPEKNPHAEPTMAQSSFALDPSSAAERGKGNVIPASEVFEALIRGLEMKEPQLTRAPLDFWADQLERNFDLQDDEEGDPFLLRAVVQKLRSQAQQEREAREGQSPEEATTEWLEKVQEAVRRSDYAEAVRLAEASPLESLSPVQRKSLEQALEAVYLGAGKSQPEVGLRACQVRQRSAELVLGGNGGGATWEVNLANAINGQGYCLVALAKPEDALAAFERILEHWQSTDHPGLQERVAKALHNKGFVFSEMGRNDEAIAAYDLLLERFAASKLPIVQWVLAWTLVDKGVVLGQMGRNDEAITAYDLLLERLAASGLPTVQEALAWALYNKGVVLGQMGRYDEAIAAYNLLLERFVASELPAAQEALAWALYNKGVRLGKMGHNDEAIAAYDLLLDRFAASELLAVQERIVKAIVNKGAVLGKMGRNDEEIAAYDLLLDRFADSELPAVQEQVAMAMRNKGVALGPMGRNDEAIAAYDFLLQRFADSELPAVQEQIAKALYNKGVVLGPSGEWAKAAFRDLVGRFADHPSPDVQELVAFARTQLSEV